MTDTRKKLLYAAERLFATNGVEGTTIREINTLAGQRNTSAIRYHFAGMNGLLTALVELRMGELDDARAQALEILESRPEVAEGIEIEDYVAVLVVPLSERVHDDVGWASWVRVLAQLVSVRGRRHRRIWEGRRDSAARAVFQRIRGRLPEIPELVWRQRAQDLMIFCVGSLCERAAQLETAGRVSKLSGEQFTGNLVQVAAAMLRAPAPRVATEA